MDEFSVNDNADAGAGSLSDSRPETGVPYEAPRVSRVRVETAALVMGKQTRDAHCTRHWHDSDATCANP